MDKPPVPATAPAAQTDDAHAAARARLRAELKRLRRLQDKLRADHERHGDPAVLEMHGEIAKTVLGRIRRGMHSIEAFDFSGQPTTLALDPVLDAKDNLALLFRRAKRARRAQEALQPRLAHAQAELARMEILRARVDDGDDTVWADIERALTSTTLPASARRKAQLSGPRLPWRTFTVRAHTVRVGRGAKDNDALTKSARGNDLWLHARGVPGSHVVVDRPGDEIAADLLVDAAHLAAHFSQARGEARVDVLWTRAKNVRKPGKHVPAGMVSVVDEHVIHVRVDDERLKQLLAAEIASSATDR